jgi:hypothetical protein
MFYKNIGKKVMGFGSLTLLPDEVKELPDGFNEKHPTVKFYIAKGWLKPAENPKDKAEAKKAAAAKKKDVDARVKALDKMTEAEIKAEAEKLGVELTEEDTADIIKGKVAEKIKAE